MIDTIIFDCDGVVLDTGPAWTESSSILLKRRGLVYEPAKIRHLLTGKTLFDSTQIMRDFYSLKDPTEDLTAERVALVSEILRRDIDYIPGFLDFFSKISGKYKFSVATSIKPELFKIADDKLKITELFRGHVYFGENLKDASKPKPDIFLHAAEKTESAPRNCLVIEDAPNGIKAAKTAGMKCVALTTTFKTELLKEADMTVDSFSEIDLSKFNEQ